MSATLLAAAALGGCAPRVPDDVVAGPPVLLGDGSGVVVLDVSPDGRWLLHDGPGEGGFDLFRIDLESGEEVTLIGGPAPDRRPGWSPDGDSIAFVSDRDGRTGIWIGAADGSGLRLLFDAGDLALSAPRWSPDGRTIGFAALDRNGIGSVSYGRSTIRAVDVSTSAAREHTSEGDEWWPSWSADGRELIYYVGKTDHLEAVDAATNAVRRLWGGAYVGWRPSPSPEGTELAFVSDLDSHGLFLADRSNGRAPRPLLRSGEPDAPSWLPDGRGLALTMDTSSTFLVRADLGTGAQDTLGVGRQPQPMADGTLSHLPDGARGSVVVRLRGGSPPDTLQLAVGPLSAFRASPDGSGLAVTFPSPGNARHDLHLLDADGVEAVALTHAGDVFDLVWCRDAAGLLVSSSTDKEANLLRRVWWVDAVRGGLSPIELGVEESLRPTDCAGRRGPILFETRDRARGIFAADLSGNVPEVTPIGSGWQGRWSPDLDRIAYIDRRDGRTDIFVRDGEEVTRITDDDAVEARVRWTPDGAALVFERRTPSRGIWLLPLRR